MKKWKVAVIQGYRYLGEAQNRCLSTVGKGEKGALKSMVASRLQPARQVYSRFVQGCGRQKATGKRIIFYLSTESVYYNEKTGILVRMMRLCVYGAEQYTLFGRIVLPPMPLRRDTHGHRPSVNLS